MTNKYRDETQNPNHIFTLDDDIDQRYDPNTETWDVIIGRCPYCNEELIRNGDLKYSNCLQVKDYDNQIILVCNRCVRYMYEKGELKEIAASGHAPGAAFTYEFFKNSNT